MPDPSHGNLIVPPQRQNRLGWLSLLFFFAIGLYLLKDYFAEKEENRELIVAYKIQSASNLNQIGQAVSRYILDNGGRYPDTFGTLFLDEELTAVLFISPGANDAPATGPTTQAVADEISRGEHVSYHYLGRGLTQATATPDTVLAYEEPGIFSNGGNVLYADGHVQTVNADALKKIAAKSAKMP